MNLKFSMRPIAEDGGKTLENIWKSTKTAWWACSFLDADLDQNYCYDLQV